MSKNDPSPAERSKQYGQNIKEEYERWHYLYENGGSDPFWPDGVNLNLVRNHILYYRRKCDEELSEPMFPPEYHLEVPPEVDDKYMARADQIPRKAAEAEKVLKDDPDYRFLQSHVVDLGDDERKQTCIGAVLGYVRNLTTAIQSGDLISMRRYSNTDIYITSFRECRKKIEALWVKPKQREYPDGYQMTVFDILNMA